MSTANKDLLKRKMKAFAKLIDGQVVDDADRVQVCIKGTVLGFPATLEAITAGWPFGVSYYIQTTVIEDPDRQSDPGALQLTLCPRTARGPFSFLARLLLFEAQGQKMGDRRIENTFVASFNNGSEALRFVNYPGVFENLMRLEHHSKFSEFLLKSGAGLSLSQPTSFNSLEANVFQETFKVLGDIGQVLVEDF